METIIVICLLIIIVLLVQDKIVIRKRQEQKPKEEKANPDLPDIMGQPKPIRKRHTMSNKAIDSQENKATTDNNSFDSEKQRFNRQIPQEDPDNVFSEVPDFEEEEEEWHQYREPNGENGFATGVTFDELSTVGVLLQKEVLEPSQQQEVVDIVQRIQGTELFSLLDSSLESASRKIAKLLDHSLSDQTDSGSSTLRKNDLDDFDIKEFI